MASESDADHRNPTYEVLRAGTQPLLLIRKVRAMLDAFSVEQPELTLTHLRELTGFPQSTCLRIAQNLCAEGFLSHSGDHYRIGIGMLRWMTIALESLDVVALSQPILKKLRDDTNETTCLFVQAGMTRVVVALAQSRHGTVRQLSVGQSIPLHAGSAGRVFLAHDPSLLSQVLKSSLTRLTPATITDPEQLVRSFDDVRDNGYALSLNESHAYCSSISMPVFAYDGSVAAAICLAGPSERLDLEAMQHWLPTVGLAAAALTSQLGGQLPQPTNHGRRITSNRGIPQ